MHCAKNATETLRWAALRASSDPLPVSEEGAARTPSALRLPGLCTAGKARGGGGAPSGTSFRGIGCYRAGDLGAERAGGRQGWEEGRVSPPQTAVRTKVTC